MNKLRTSFLVLLFVMSISCTNEDDILISNGEINSQKVSEVIQDASIEQLKIYEWISDDSGTDWDYIMTIYGFKIESPFLMTIVGDNYNGSYYYDLNYLTKFDYLGNSMSLYFKY